ncbi:MAG: response regulator transcription factor [Patescibacteria group bacterium]
MMRILIVEDEERMAKTLVKGLQNSGYATKVINDGLYARLENISEFDLVILDWMLPKFNGLEVLEYWRKEKKFTTPILMFTAKNDTNSIVKGLDFGADDYMSKFFTWDELNARIRTILRRSKKANVNIDLPITYDNQNQSFIEDQKVVSLTSSEFKILLYFFEHPTKLISRSQLSNAIYNGEFDPSSNTIERHIKSIRSKFIYDPILTIRGSGYRLRLSDQSKKS